MKMHNSYNIISIRFEPDGFSLSAIDANRNTVSEFFECKPFESEKEEILIHLKKITETYSLPAKFSIQNYPHIIVPSEFFDEKSAEDLLKFHISDLKHSEIRYNLIRPINAVNIFYIPTNLISAISEQFETSDIEHHTTFLLENVVLKKTGDFTFIFANKEKSDFFKISNNKLVYYNSFQTNTAEDLAFYILSIFNYLQLQPGTEIVYLLNDSANHNLFDTAKKYITNFFQA